MSVLNSAIREDEPAHALFESRGWKHVRTFYTMRIDFDGPPDPVEFADGLTLRTVREGEDLTALAAAVDARAGTKVIFAKRAYSTWGDVEAACQIWSKRVAWQLTRLGVKRKPGVAMPTEEPTESRSF